MVYCDYFEPHLAGVGDIDGDGLDEIPGKRASRGKERAERKPSSTFRPAVRKKALPGGIDPSTAHARLSAGLRWPPVPPAAKRILIGPFALLAG